MPKILQIAFISSIKFGCEGQKCTNELFKIKMKVLWLSTVQMEGGGCHTETPKVKSGQNPAGGQRDQAKIRAAGSANSIHWQGREGKN